MSDRLLEIKESCASNEIAKTTLGEQKEIINDDVSQYKFSFLISLSLVR